MRNLNLPNLLTLGNLCCGIIAIIQLLHPEGHRTWIPYLMLIALLADFLDGWLARKLKTAGPLGVQLDSLSDVLTFGVLPALLIFDLMRSATLWENGLAGSYWPYLALILAAASSLRLAKFNIDERQSENFIGLATPAAALMVLGIFCSVNADEGYFLGLWDSPVLSIRPFLSHGIFLITLTLDLSFLLNAELTMPSLKPFQKSSKGPLILVLLLMGCGMLFSFFGFFSLALIISIYIILSIFKRF